MKPKNLRAKLFGSIALCTIAVAASPIAAQADEDGPSCTVSYYLTAPYEDETGNYDHVVVFEDDCELPVECQLESEDVSRTIVLEGSSEHRVKLSDDNERPSFDATAKCTAER